MESTSSRKINLLDNHGESADDRIHYTTEYLNIYLYITLPQRNYFFFIWIIHLREAGSTNDKFACNFAPKTTILDICIEKLKSYFYFLGKIGPALGESFQF